MKDLQEHIKKHLIQKDFMKFNSSFCITNYSNRLTTKDFIEVVKSVLENSNKSYTFENVKRKNKLDYLILELDSFEPIKIVGKYKGIIVLCNDKIDFKEDDIVFDNSTSSLFYSELLKEFHIKNKIKGCINYMAFLKIKCGLWHISFKFVNNGLRYFIAF